MNPYPLLGLAIVIEVVATTALQYSAGFTNPVPTAVVVVGYLASFYLLSLILSQLPIGLVYATWSAGAIVLIAAIGTVFLGQRIDPAGVVGIGLIVAGVYLLNVVSDVSVH
ncbi:multidrug efflux SMR transporter [Halococcus sp. IIIV-5B]|uniref:DMT family transporter n=1 Tax=Halococcus sp. IIIV-5B TaxID=2321230 RepID=UPI000E70B7D2|nr:multidrug efflux SMR transporter [Halococcus sp. IIIV-5B]RJT06198.1 QacE family quaternary ammonium compound efflux SMR transporter [Halococcus sp. IIIV-5B]